MLRAQIWISICYQTVGLWLSTQTRALFTHDDVQTWLKKRSNFGILDLRVLLIRPTSTSAWNCIFFLDCCGSFVHFYDSQFFFLCQYERTLQLRVWRSQCLDSLLGGDLLSGIALLYNKTKMFNKHCNASLYNTLSFRRYSTCTFYLMEWGGRVVQHFHNVDQTYLTYAPSSTSYKQNKKVTILNVERMYKALVRGVSVLKM